MTYSVDQKERAGAVNYNPSAHEYTPFYKNFKPAYEVEPFTEQGVIKEPSDLEQRVRQLPVLSDQHRTLLKSDRLPSKDAQDVSRIEVSILHLCQENIDSIFALCAREYNNPNHAGKQFLKYREKSDIAAIVDLNPKERKGGVVLALSIKDSYGTSHLAAVAGVSLVNDDDPNGFGSGGIPFKPHRKKHAETGEEIVEICPPEQSILYNMSVVDPLFQGSGYNLAKIIQPVRDDVAVEMGRMFEGLYYVTKTNSPSTQSVYGEKLKWHLSLSETLTGKEGTLHTYVQTLAEMVRNAPGDIGVRQAVAAYCKSIAEQQLAASGEGPKQRPRALKRDKQPAIQ